MSVRLGPGASFGRYRIESELGRGGMSVVYLAEDPSPARRVAIKVLAPELAADAAFRLRGRRGRRRSVHRCGTCAAPTCAA